MMPPSEPELHSLTNPSSAVTLTNHDELLTNPLPHPAGVGVANPAAVGVNTGGGNAVSDIVALNLEVNTSALNINDRPSPDHTPRPRDFLDLVDSVAHTDWSATPTRPRMFPHKLY